MNNKNTAGKLMYIQSTETEGPIPAVLLANDPTLEAPILADYTPPSIESANQFSGQIPGTGQTPGTARPPPPGIGLPSPEGRPPPAPQGSSWTWANGAWRLVRRGGAVGPAVGLFFWQNNPVPWNVATVEYDRADPNEVALADHAYENGSDLNEVWEWFQ